MPATVVRSRLRTSGSDWGGPSKARGDDRQGVAEPAGALDLLGEFDRRVGRVPKAGDRVGDVADHRVFVAGAGREVVEERRGTATPLAVRDAVGEARFDHRDGRALRLRVVEGGGSGRRRRHVETRGREGFGGPVEAGGVGVGEDEGYLRHGRCVLRIEVFG
jgi:hypothetical protein